MTKRLSESVAVERAKSAVTPLNPELPRAVTYLRVSTKDQAEAGGEREGFSIPAQREACLHKAESMGVAVVEEFVDRGESAKSADRPELQRLIRYVEENPIDFVIVHKVDRLARNRVDDVTINLALQQAGAMLVSVTESIDETPSGMLLHGIMSSIAEFYSRNLATEVMKGIQQKLKRGGTVSKAPLGYRNVIRLEKGREVRTVELDPERAELVREAFELYATGQWTVRTLLDHVTDRGLTNPPNRRYPERRLVLSHLHKMLRNPYYIGFVTYQGVQYPGTHQPLVELQTWEEVQNVLTAHDAVSGTKQRKHRHYLKGLLYCSDCGSRLAIENVKGKGGRYTYYFCLGRQTKRTSCTRKAMRIEEVEKAVERCWASVRLTKEMARDVEAWVMKQLTERRDLSERELSKKQRLVTKLRAEQQKLLHAHYADAIPLDLLKSEQQRILTELTVAELAVERLDLDFARIGANLHEALALASNCYRLYRQAPPQVRRWLNLAFFERLEIEEEFTVHPQLAGPFTMLLHPGAQARATRRRPAPTYSRSRSRSLVPALGSGAEELDDEPFFFGQGFKDDALVGKGGFELSCAARPAEMLCVGGASGATRRAETAAYRLGERRFRSADVHGVHTPSSASWTRKARKASAIGPGS